MNYKPEELLNAIVSCSPDGYIVSDHTGKITFVSETIEKLTGWNEKELLGKDVKKVYSLPENLLPRDINGELTTNPQAAILIRRDGKKITLTAKQIELKSFSNNKTDKEFTGYLTIFDAKNKLDLDKDVTRVQDEFVSTVSHELRTPLTSIKGFADTLLRTGPKLSPENQKKYLTIIKEQADRLTRLVEDLLSVSRLEMQSQQLTIRAIDLKKAIEKVCDSLSSKVQAHKIAQHIEEDIPSVWADADKLEQVLTNLVDNAIKYSLNDSTITIKVTTLINEQNVKDKLKIEITDQGVGIADKDLSKIFTKFGRLDNPLTRQTQGTGLGLFITKSLVLALKGEISVKSKPGETTFTIILPAAVASQAIPLSTAIKNENLIKEEK